MPANQYLDLQLLSKNCIIAGLIRFRAIIQDLNRRFFLGGGHNPNRELRFLI